MPVCAVCGVANLEEARFCMACAAPLATDGGDRRERRVVSVLFADIVGYTARSERSDVEDVEDLLRGYYAVLRRDLERHGGVVEKFIGDAVVAVFGAPTAHEDDPERAVRAGFAIQESVRELRAREAVDIQVRVGITTGEALVTFGASDGGASVVGDVVNTAARIQSAAPAGSVLVDEVTRDASHRAIRYAPADAIDAKGKSDPVTVWLAVGPRTAVPEQPRETDVPLVGRGEEIAQLLAVLARSRREPSTQLVTIVGPPGIGKSRLLRELRRRVELEPGSFCWLRGRSLAYGDGITFWALGEMVKAEAQILESDSADVAAGKLERAIAAVVEDRRDRAWVGQHLRPLVGLESLASASAEGRGAEAFAAWRRFFEALAERQPTILVFEDVHWADDALLDFVDLLTDRAGDVPLLIVCTARPELLERRSGWGGGKTNSTTISLAALSEDETSHFVNELLGQMELRGDAQRSLLAQAEGNPLYAQEYVRMLRDRGLLVSDAGGWRLVGAASGLPESVHGIIAARIDTLTEVERRFVHDASVIGRTAWLGAVCVLSGRDPSEADELLYALERKQLVRRSRHSSVEGEVELSFAHALIRDVAYAQIRRADRARAHARVAAWIEQLEHERADTAELVAHHYVTALRLHQEIGDVTPEVTDRARMALVAAGRQADGMNGYAAAVRHYAAAVDLMPPADPERPQLLLAHALAAYRAATPDAPQIMTAAFDALVAADDSWSAATAAHLLGEWALERSDHDAAERWLNRAEHHAERSGNSHVLVMVAENRVTRLGNEDRHDEALALAEQTLELAREAGDLEDIGLMLLRCGAEQVSTGDPGGVDRIAESIEILEARGSVYVTWALTDMAQADGIILGDLLAGARHLKRASTSARRFGEFRLTRDVDSRASWFAYHSGDWETARELADELVNASSPWARWFYLWVHATLAIARGDDAAARADSQAFDEWDPDTSPAVDALIAQASGRHAEAHAACVEALASIEGYKYIAAPLVAELIPIATAHDRIAAIAADLPDGNRWKSVLLAVGAGRHAEAVTMFKEIGSQPLAARAQMLAAQTAIREGAAHDAARHADAAFGFYTRVGATRYAEQAASLRSAPV
jgi:class 3 adenylate cyclase/tetratricopeptide (TPR) repeat protein